MNTSFEIEDSENLVEISFHVTPYFPGNYEDPPEGGELEIDELKWSIRNEDNKENLLTSFLSKEKIKEIESWIEDEIYENHQDGLIQSYEEDMAGRCDEYWDQRYESRNDFQS